MCTGYICCNTQQQRYIDQMLCRRRRWRANINPALGQCIVFAE